MLQHVDHMRRHREETAHSRRFGGVLSALENTFPDTTMVLAEVGVLPDTQLPLRVMSLKGTNLDSLIAPEPVASFAYADSLLALSPFAAVPMATDGKTNVRIVEDQIAAVSSESLGDPFPLLPAIGEFLGFGEPEPYSDRRQWVVDPLPSPDGKHLAFNAQSWDSDVWLIDNF